MKATIKRISEFTSPLGVTKTSKTQITVYYESGRKVSYCDNDTLPMSVVEFLTSDKTTSDTIYIPDSGKFNKRTTYRQ